MAWCALGGYKTPHKADVQEIRSSKPNWTLLWPPELTTEANIATHSPLFSSNNRQTRKWAPSQLRTIWKKRFKMVDVVFVMRLSQLFHSLKPYGKHKRWQSRSPSWHSWSMISNCVCFHVTGEAGEIQLMSYAVLGPWSRRSRSQSGDSGLRVRVDTGVVSFTIIIPAQYTLHARVYIHLVFWHARTWKL